MSALVESLIAYAHLSLILALVVGVIWWWDHPAARRPYLYVLVAFGWLYLLDVLHELTPLPLLDDDLYARVHQLLTISVISGAVWITLVQAVIDWRRREGARQAVDTQGWGTERARADEKEKP